MTCEMLYQATHRHYVVMEGILREDPYVCSDGTVFAQWCDETGIIGIKIDHQVDTAVWQQGASFSLSGVVHAPPGRRPWVQIYRVEPHLEL
jgi:hypothetical protein